MLQTRDTSLAEVPSRRRYIRCTEGTVRGNEPAPVVVVERYIFAKCSIWDKISADAPELLGVEHSIENISVAV